MKQNESVWGTKKQIQRRRLEQNKSRGQMGQTIFVMTNRASGREVTSTGRGSDYTTRDVNVYGQKGKKIINEIKTGNAKLSKLQKKEQARLGPKRYKVIRYG